MIELECSIDLKFSEFILTVILFKDNIFYIVNKVNYNDNSWKRWDFEIEKGLEI